MNEQSLTWYDLGVDIHTALRKYCDSPQTSAMCNIIHMDAFRDAWEAYLKSVISKLEGNLSMIDALQKSVEELPYRQPDTNVMRCVFRCFDDDDWQGIVSFISEAI